MEMQAEQANERQGGDSQASQLLKLAEDIELFHTADSKAYAKIMVNEHSEIWAIRGDRFKNFLGRFFYERTGKAASSQAVQDALGVLEAKANFDGEQHEVGVRLAEHNGNIYLDLADDKWRAVEIRPDGWSILDESPVRFRRPSGMLPLPEPIAGGSLDALRVYANVETEDDWVLFRCVLLGMLQPCGPFPVVTLHGEQGSAKARRQRSCGN